MKKISLHQGITILATLLTITVNGLANALPLNGQGTGEISDRFDIYFVPAGYVFSIWGLIYLGLVAFSIYQALPAQKDSELLKRFAPAYWIGSLANVAWIFLWHYEFFPLTLIAMFTILVTLIYIHKELSKSNYDPDRDQKWFIRFPFSIYLGWISVAMIANISQVLFSSGWDGWGISSEAWAIIMIAIATALGLLMRWREKDTLYVLVLVWAFVGIAMEQSTNPLVSNTAWISAGLLTLVVMFLPLLNKLTRKGA